MLKYILHILKLLHWFYLLCICCTQQVVRQIHNNSNQWSLSISGRYTIGCVNKLYQRRYSLTLKGRLHCTRDSATRNSLATLRPVFVRCNSSIRCINNYRFAAPKLAFHDADTDTDTATVLRPTHAVSSRVCRRRGIPADSLNVQTSPPPELCVQLRSVAE